MNLLLLSDIHYAGPAETARGGNYEMEAISNTRTRFLARAYRHWFWMRNPLDRTPQFHAFLRQPIEADHVIVNGDFAMDSGFIGVSDPACLESARICLDALAQKFGDRLRLVLGDHELGKRTLFSNRGNMSLESWKLAIEHLRIHPFWQINEGCYVLMGVTSSLITLPAHSADILPEDQIEWQKLRVNHLDQIRKAFSSLEPNQRVLLFCHDPTALPFLAAEREIRDRLGQVEQTVIGHLHSDLVLWKSRFLAGMPVLRGLGPSVAKMTAALHLAREWAPFKVRLCPALAGIELLNDGGYFMANLDPLGRWPVRFEFYSLPR